MPPHGRPGVVHAADAVGDWSERVAERKELSSETDIVFKPSILFRCEFFTAAGIEKLKTCGRH
jgi:hypothetical protein